MLKIIISITTLVSILLLSIFLNISTPASAGPFGILAIFIFAYLSSLGLVTYLLYLANHLFAYMSTLFVTRRPYEALSFKHSYYFSTIIAAAPVMLVGLQSVGATGLYEMMLVVSFVIIGCLYVSKKVQ